MKFRILPSFLAILLPMAAFAAEEVTPATPKPWWNRLVHPFGGKKEDKAAETSPAATNFRNLEMGLQIEPNPVKLSDNRQVKVTLTLTNKGSKLTQLEFPTSQRIEVIVRGKGGQLLVQWSEDQAFTQEMTQVTINPSERLEYSVNVSTRDLVPGESYIVEGFFPNFDKLRKERPLTTEK